MYSEWASRESGGREQRGVALTSKICAYPEKMLGVLLFDIKQKLKLMEFVNHHQCSECFFFASEAASRQCQNSSLSFQRRLRVPPNPILPGFGFPARCWCTSPLAYGSWSAQQWGGTLCPELRFAARCHTADLLSRAAPSCWAGLSVPCTNGQTLPFSWLRLRFLRKEAWGCSVWLSESSTKSRVLNGWRKRSFVEQYYKRRHQAIFMEIEWCSYGSFSTSAFNIKCIVNTGGGKKKTTCQNIALFGYLCPRDNFSNLSINGLLNSLSKAQSAISDDISVSIIYWIKAKFEAKQAQFVNHFSVFSPLTTWQLLTFHFYIPCS